MKTLEVRNERGEVVLQLKPACNGPYTMHLDGTQVEPARHANLTSCCDILDELIWPQTMRDFTSTYRTILPTSMYVTFEYGQRDGVYKLRALPFDLLVTGGGSLAMVIKEMKILLAGVDWSEYAGSK